MRILCTALATLALLGLSGCGGSDEAVEKPSGTPTLATPSGLVDPLPSATVKGRLLMVGGPVGTARPVRGTVTFKAADGTTARTNVDSGGEFQISLTPGPYELRGTSPDYQGGKATCVSEGNPTVLTEGETTTVDINCPIR
jgi:hypothetical protein